MQKKAYIILLVDDDDDDFLLLKIYLRQIPECQIVLEWEDSYQKALQSLQQHLPDMLFVDYNLNSSLNGLDLVQELKRCAPHIPAFLITAQDKFAFDKHAAFPLIDGYIHKNQLSPQVLAETISQHFK
jgi:two-component system, cell cycle sensor histidine kinase and response regulator CckA